jgi:hypothetical protein
VHRLDQREGRGDEGRHLALAVELVHDVRDLSQRVENATERIHV